MFDLNEKIVVTTRENAVGRIKAIESPDFYMTKFNKNQFENWDNNFPDWKTKAVYAIQLDQPVRQLTFEEFQEQNLGEDPLVLETKYKMMPMYSGIYAVEDALELLNV